MESDQRRGGRFRPRLSRSLAPRRLLVTALLLAATGSLTTRAGESEAGAPSWYETAHADASSQPAAAQSERSSEARAEPAAKIVSGPAAFPSLAPAASQERTPDGEPDSGGGGSPAWSSPVITIASSLSVVLGLFAGLVWLTRRFGTKTGGGGALPPAALQPLGSRVIDARTRVMMFRCGQRILIVAQTAGGMHPLSEITDPAEVDQLIASCQSDSRQAFAQTIQSLEQEPAAGGFLGADAPPSPGPGRRLFATG